MIIPIVLGTVEAIFAGLEAGVKIYGRGRDLWRAVRGTPAPPAPPPTALSYRDVEHQRDQMRAATSHGTVTGGTAPGPPERAGNRGSRSGS